MDRKSKKSFIKFFFNAHGYGKENVAKAAHVRRGE